MTGPGAAVRMTDGGRSISTDPAEGRDPLGPTGLPATVGCSPTSWEMTMSYLTPPARRIDPRGQRFGAGVSALILVAAFVLDQPWLAVLVGIDLAVSSAFGTRWFLPSRPWASIRRVLRLAPVELEHEYPPRFAQALGTTFLGLAAVAFVVVGTTLGWLLIGAVAALQTLLAVTGICIGCRLYFLRWWVPSLFAQIFRRSDERQRLAVPKLVRVD